MSGLEKIIGHIETSAADTAAKLIETATADAEKILKTGKEEALAKEAAINRQAELDVAAASKRIESSADQTLKRLLLQEKQQQIDGVIKEAVDTLKNLSIEDYFKVILHMIPKYAPDREGEICFSAKDLERLPKGFEKKINSAMEAGTLTLSKEPVDIDGGFVLKYGDIEENCSFEALVESSREVLQDKIGQILFD